MNSNTISRTLVTCTQCTSGMRRGFASLLYSSIVSMFRNNSQDYCVKYKFVIYLGGLAYLMFCFLSRKL